MIAMIATARRPCSSPGCDAHAACRHQRAARERAPGRGTRRRRRDASSMRSSWLYFATRSLRAGAPVLIWPQFVATARSAIVASSVSPLRCDMTDVYAARLASVDRVERLGERADLVDLHEHRVGDAALDALAQPLGVGDEHVVADELDPVAEALGEGAPAVPVVLGHAVLDRDDRIAVAEIGEVVDELGRGELPPFAGERVRRRRRRTRSTRRRPRARSPRPGL